MTASHSTKSRDIADTPALTTEERASIQAACWSWARAGGLGAGSSSTTACSITFCNSRTFPGQSYDWSSSSLADVRRGALTPSLRADSRTKCPTSAGMSSVRSRNGGSSIGNWTWVGKTAAPALRFDLN